MTAQSIMTSPALTLSSNDKVLDALLLMSKHHIHNLPVVDDQGCFLGLFGMKRLIQSLLPNAIKLKHHGLTLTNLEFMTDDPDGLVQDLKAVGGHPVKDFIVEEKSLCFCQPDTPFYELLNLLYQCSDHSLPVLIVENNHQHSKRVVGMVSAWDILDKVALQVFKPECGQGKS